MDKTSEAEAAARITPARLCRITSKMMDAMDDGGRFSDAEIEAFEAHGYCIGPRPLTPAQKEVIAAWGDRNI